MSEPVTPEADPLVDIIRDFAELSARAERARILTWIERFERPSDWEQELWTSGPEIMAFLGAEGLAELHELQRRAGALKHGPLTSDSGLLRVRADRLVERRRRWYQCR